MNNEKIDYMVGMTQNMMNIAEKNIENSTMPHMYLLTSIMMGNLNHMKLMENTNEEMTAMMEPMMRGMEHIMVNSDMNNNTQMEVLKNMMGYIIGMQMQSLIHSL